MPLNALQPGTAVHIKESGSAGILSRTAATPKSYVVDTDKGTVRRNCSPINNVPPHKLTTTCSSDKAPTPCKSEKQPQLKHETPVKPLPSPYLLSTPKRIIRPSLKLKETQRQLNLACLTLLVMGMLVFGLLLHVTYSCMQNLHVVSLLQKAREMLHFCY